MKGAYTVLLLSTFVIASAGAASSAGTQTQDALAPDEITWSAGPPSLPAGAQSAVLYGDPSKEGVFALRIKFPKGYRIPPHTHPRPEVVTVISGSFAIGMGETLDASEAKKLPAGGFFAIEPGMAHYGIVDEGAVVQINSSGPWAIKYVNPDDDPRQKTQ
jgi:quercetin dioxygenase-like cupin family protein